MSRTLLGRLDRGQLDLALVKCLPADRRPETPILTERLVGVGIEERSPLARVRPLPLAVHPEPSVTRVIMLERLAAMSIPWEITHTANTLSALRAGVSAGPSCPRVSARSTGGRWSCRSWRRWISFWPKAARGGTTRQRLSAT